MKVLSKRFYDENARIEELVLLAGAIGDWHLLDAVENFFEEDFKDIESCLGELPEYVKDDIESNEHDSLVEWLIDNGKLGFLLKMATPIMEQCGNGASFSWGYYTTKWVYGDTLDSAIEAGFSWVAEQRKKENIKMT